jgi:putative heme iron utilization protein
MGPEDRALLKSLLGEERLLTLGLAVDGEPVVGLLPFAVAEDFSAVYIQASQLARHARGLTAGARFGAVVHRPDRPEADPLQVPRVILEGVVDPLGGDHPHREAGTRAFVRRFPKAAMTLALPDFSLYRLEIQGGRVVAGFGNAQSLSSGDFRDLAGE